MSIKYGIKNQMIGSKSIIYRNLIILFGFIFAFNSWRIYGEPRIIDSIEYSVGASRFFSGDGYTILINGKSYPPRYPPLFSILISPGFIFTDKLYVAAIIPAIITFLGIILTWKIGFKLNGTGGAIGACLGLFFVKEYWFWGGMAMADTPIAVISLLSLLLLIIDYNAPYLVGIIVAVAAALKLPGIVLIIPWICIWIYEGKYKNVLQSFLPIGIIAIAIMLYQKEVFGSFFRNGYQFWCSIPYDFFELTFSPKYLLSRLTNFDSIWNASVFPVILACIGSFCFYFKRTKETSILLKKAFLHSTIIIISWSLIMLFYFYEDTRLYIVVISNAAIFTGILASLWGFKLPKSSMICLLIIVFGSLIYTNLSREKLVSMQIDIPENVNTPIVTDVDAAYVSYYYPQYRVIPKSRANEYASKIIMRNKPIKNFIPISPIDHRNPELVKQGEEVFEFVANDLYK